MKTLFVRVLAMTVGVVAAAVVSPSVSAQTRRTAPSLYTWHPPPIFPAIIGGAYVTTTNDLHVPSGLGPFSFA